MYKIQGKLTMVSRLTLGAGILLLAFTTVALAQGGRYKVSPWSFGVHGDTQWTVEGNPEDNPNRVAVAIIHVLNEQFIAHGVNFVIQTGDLTDYAGKAGFETRAAAAQALYDHGIGFFPLRGNHETYGYLMGWDPDYNLNVPDYLTAFPQTRGMGYTFGATNFSSPNDLISGVDILDGLSYSFDYGTNGNNARFVIVDTEMTAVTHNVAPIDATYGQGYFYLGWIIYRYPAPLNGKVAFYDETKGPRSDYRAWSAVPGIVPANAWFRISGGAPSTNFYGFEEVWPFDLWRASENNAPGGEIWPGRQQPWISAQLDETTRGTEHAFVLSHRPVLNGNHVDSFFGASSAVTPGDQNAFFASLMNNDVKFMISGHDHLYNRALVKSPDGLSEIEQIVTQGASTKFYAPTRLDDFGSGVKARETQISQEIYNFGYYIYTVDGPRVTVDYYSDSVGNFVDGDQYPDGSGSLQVPTFDFVKQETWGYSLNGKQFLVRQGDSYTVITDSFGKTTAKILSGTNNSKTADYTPVGYNTNGVQVSGPRPLNKTVNTGWVANPAPDRLESDILSLWGMSELGVAKQQTDIYALSMSFNPQKGVHLGNEGGIGTIVSLDSNGNWINAVDLNIGNSTKIFISGPYNAKKHGLGTYGFDPSTRSAWAVVDYNADFAVVNDIVTVPPGQAKTNQGKGK